MSRGEPPTQQTLDALNYLRQLGVPFTEHELGGGRGQPVYYRFDHLAEAGVALFALRRGFRPKEISDLLLKKRREVRHICREAVREQPEAVREAAWVKSRGAVPSRLTKEIFMRLYDRYSDKPGEIEICPGSPRGKRLPFGDGQEKYPGDAIRTLLPVTRLMLELVAWAEEAPDIKAGRK